MEGGLLLIMADGKQLSLLKRGTDDWNSWRTKNHQAIIDGSIKLDLSGADLRGANLDSVALWGADLKGADFSNAELGRANLGDADLTDAKFRDAILYGVSLSYSKLDGTDLRGADLTGAYFIDTDLSKAQLTGAILSDTNLSFQSLHGHDLKSTTFEGSNLTGTDFSNADLSGSNLSRTLLIDTNFSEANLSDCQIFGISAWNLNLKDAKQSNLTITKIGEPPITIDNVEIAQFVYLVLNNPKLRDVIDTIGRKAVLILGRFSPKRKAVLDTIRAELRNLNYVPIVFDFDVPVTRNTTETVVTLAHLSRFIIADITSAKSIIQELQVIVPNLKVAVQPIISANANVYSMFDDIAEHSSVLSLYQYKSTERLIAKLPDLIESAENKAKELRPNS